MLDGILAEAEINAEHFGVCSSCYNTALNRVTNPHQSIRDERLALGLSQSELVTLASMDYTFGSAMVHLSPKTIIPVISALKRDLMSASGIAAALHEDWVLAIDSVLHAVGKSSATALQEDSDAACEFNKLL